MTSTTIQIDVSTKSDLEQLKRVDGESYDSVVKMLIANYNEPQENAGLDESDVEAIVNRKIDELKRELR